MPCVCEHDQRPAGLVDAETAGAADFVPTVWGDGRGNHLNQAVEVHLFGVGVAVGIDGMHRGGPPAAPPGLQRRQLAQPVEQQVDLLVDIVAGEQHEIERLRKDADASRAAHFVPGLWLDRARDGLDGAVEIGAILLLLRSLHRERGVRLEPGEAVEVARFRRWSIGPVGRLGFARHGGIAAAGKASAVGILLWHSEAAPAKRSAGSSAATESSHASAHPHAAHRHAGTHASAGAHRHPAHSAHEPQAGGATQPRRICPPARHTRTPRRGPSEVASRGVPPPARAW